MKTKFYLVALTLIMALSTLTTQAHAAVVKETKKEMVARISTMTEEQKQARVLYIKNRVEEIRTMDKSNLSRDERKALREELKSMRAEGGAFGSGGVYLSLAGIVIIVLLLILIL